MLLLKEVIYAFSSGKGRLLRASCKIGLQFISRLVLAFIQDFTYERFLNFINSFKNLTIRKFCFIRFQREYFILEGRILCFDEKTNRLVRIDLRSNERQYFAVPLEFQFQHYYWSHLSEINK
uniref:Uncharacterized protein n=1 Tax=Ascaris lumbricoides TaxID=6252 RepID=A0A0M3HKP7_ASCLU